MLFIRMVIAMISDPPSTAAGWGTLLPADSQARRMFDAAAAALQLDDPTSYWASHPSVRLPSRQFSVVTLGGSSSAYTPNYGHYLQASLYTMASGSAVNAPAISQVSNPSQGGTGSDWASLFFDSLVPQTDLLLWEFSINDWSRSGVALSDERWREQALELFLARARVHVPRAIVGLIFLWRPSAITCWPHCAGEDDHWRAALRVLDHYSSLGMALFAINVRTR